MVKVQENLHVALKVNFSALAATQNIRVALTNFCLLRGMNVSFLFWWGGMG